MRTRCQRIRLAGRFIKANTMRGIITQSRLCGPVLEQTAYFRLVALAWSR